MVARALVTHPGSREAFLATLMLGSEKMQLNWRFKSLRESCKLTALNVLELPNRTMSRRKLLQNGTCRHFDANLHECLSVATLQLQIGSIALKFGGERIIF